MNNREIVFAAIVLIVGYWYFKIRPGRGRLAGNRGAGGTVWGGASKRPSTWHNTNPRTNAQQGGMYMPTRTAYTGPVPGGPATSNVGGSRSGGFRSWITTGPSGSFVSNQWPTQRVTAMGVRQINSGITQIPSYTAIPLTAQGPGGGGSLTQ